MAADGRPVELTLRPLPDSDRALDLAILVDRSGSTGNAVGRHGATFHSAIRHGLEHCLTALGGEDRIGLWQFDTTCEFLGTASGPGAANLVARIAAPGGGTELGPAVSKLLAKGARDILVLTDGQTWAHTVDELASSECRISAVLVGRGSLDANIGHLITQTGGQLVYAPGDEVTTALGSALIAVRSAGRPALGTVQGEQPPKLTCLRGGVEISARWDAPARDLPADAFGRFAAALALPLMKDGSGVALALAHGLCNHATSLILVDEAGAATHLLPELRKVALARAPNAALIHCCKSPDSFAPGVHEQRSSETRQIAPADALLDLAHRIDWEVSVNRFLQGDLHSLAPDDHKALRDLCDTPAFVAMATALGLGVELVALALVAAGVRQCNLAAERFLRHVLGPEVDEKLLVLRRAVQAPVRAAPTRQRQRSPGLSARIWRKMRGLPPGN